MRRPRKPQRLRTLGHVQAGEAILTAAKRFRLIPVAAIGWLLACLALAAALAGVPTATGAELGTERGIKAAFITKFIGYVGFPNDAPGQPLVIGVAGAGDIAADLTRIVANRTIDGRKLSVRALAPNERLDGVQVLFIGVGASDRAERLLRAASAQGILTITEYNTALRDGSVINFRLVDERVRF
ncbi:MAG: YfiR family protein, partial [Telluria sp.]